MLYQHHLQIIYLPIINNEELFVLIHLNNLNHFLDGNQFLSILKYIKIESLFFFSFTILIKKSADRILLINVNN